VRHASRVSAGGAPLAVPMNSESLYAGKETMKRYAEATQCMVGLENLAFAFSQEDAKRQGDFVDKLIASVDGFLLLDLHNIYCQLENFRLTEKFYLTHIHCRKCARSIYPGVHGVRLYPANDQPFAATPTMTACPKKCLISPLWH
jgi:uncharacterized protein (UPF0276 family)